CRSGHWLNLLLLGERAARHAGLPVASVKRLLVVLVALQVGAAVAITGVIGFVGLVVPHMVRLLIGPDHRMLLPASIFGGAVLLLTADLVARSIVAPAELPIGLVTTLIGGPFFLLLLLQRRQRSAFG
ncbi:MAG: iron chelate uptake ABC transporter family permease subunit, partial [Gammaproteobacteria bacterium]|nr:iron chelate uptake ABC transporter family permease subunit [Gammaproteobacteria bacterium]